MVPLLTEVFEWERRSTTAVIEQAEREGGDALTRAEVLHRAASLVLRG